VWILGLRSGYGLAYHAGHYLSMTRPDVQVLSAGGGTYSHDIASVGSDDVLLVIAFRRRPRGLATLLTEVVSSGATTILVTDLSASASSRASTHVLRCHCHSPSPFNSFSAAVTLINYLAWRVGTMLGENGMDQYLRIDRLVRQLDNVSTPQSDKPG
jgi:DNA-binding MurR/RpiR family transcriptional regulator